MAPNPDTKVDLNIVTAIARTAGAGIVLRGVEA